ncbi:MAG: hypothetical protein JNN32_07975 [Flavobacteriales bacterium]|nr:hypothetical protein [Flavobacteriales bacterium]
MSALDKPTFERIEAYVLGRLSADERLAFEQRLSTDAALRAEVELERENIMAIELGGLQRVLEQVRGEQVIEQGHGGPWISYLKYAAVVAVLFGAALWFIARPNANERTFAAHFVPDPGLPVAMSASDDHAFHDAMVAYKLGDHDEAISKWSALLKEEPSNDTLRYYIGCTELNAGRSDRAVSMLMSVADQSGSAFAAKARWYAFLALVRKGDVAAARAVPFAIDHPYAARAKSVIAELE